MTRTRVVFFSILGVFLTIIAASVAMQIIGELLLRQIFIAGTIFSVGVVALDFMGIFGGDQSGDGSGVDSGDTGGNFAGEVGDPTGDLSAEMADDGGTTSTGDSDIGSGPTLVLSVLTYLRLLVYFCLGFGPVGLVALLTGRSALIALLLAVPIGVIAVFLAQAFFRFQQSDTDSSVKGKELLMREATVTVPLTHSTMGRVRLQLGMSVVDQYALAENPEADFKRGDTVRIVRVTPDCVYVR
jgi:membrane protein implicated in regulation of membrane protease activity